MELTTREEVRQRIDRLEALESVMAAIDDVSGAEFDPGKSAFLDLAINDRGISKAPVAFAHALPQSVVLAGLQAMQRALENSVEAQ